ncbi:hypothetical protein WKW46_03270 [Staphylococcus xylosus]
MKKSQIVTYWDKRADSFGGNKQAELESKHALTWIDEINQIAPIHEGMKILDIGTGAWIFSNLMHSTRRNSYWYRFFTRNDRTC